VVGTVTTGSVVAVEAVDDVVDVVVGRTVVVVGESDPDAMIPTTIAQTADGLRR
jgi:hypothetical protein